jgi:hypothetical protein
MAKPPISLRDIDSRRAGGCQKPNCESSGTLHRHHKRHEALWLGIWSGRRRTETKWKEFVNRYYSFVPEDCVILCANHHAEIHNIYDKIISHDRRQTGRRLSKYTWPQAEKLMDKLERACIEWLAQQTPGIDYHTFKRERRGGNRNARSK